MLNHKVLTKASMSCFTLVIYIVKVVGEDTFEEAMEEDSSERVLFDFELDRLIGASPASASVLDIITASGLPLPFTFALEEAHWESSEEASTSKTTFLKDIIATTDAPGNSLPSANHLYQGSMDQGPLASFLGSNQSSQAAQDVTSSTRQNYLNSKIPLA